MEPNGDPGIPAETGFEILPGSEPAAPPTARPSRRDRLREWAARPGPTPFVQPIDEVMLDVRKHWMSLAAAALRTLAGLFTLLLGLTFVGVLAFALATGAWAQQQLRKGIKTSAMVAGVAVVVLVLLGNSGSSLGQRALCLLVLLLWAAYDVSDWYEDRLVVTRKRIYRRYGVLTRHAPSLALTGITFIDAELPPVGSLCGYGTLRFDSAAQADDPLARLDFIPDVRTRHHRILELRAEALPKFPKLES